MKHANHLPMQVKKLKLVKKSPIQFKNGVKSKKCHPAGGEDLQGQLGAVDCGRTPSKVGPPFH